MPLSQQACLLGKDLLETELIVYITYVCKAAVWQCPLLKLLYKFKKVNFIFNWTVHGTNMMHNISRSKLLIDKYSRNKQVYLKKKKKTLLTIYLTLIMSHIMFSLAPVSFLISVHSYAHTQSIYLSFFVKMKSTSVACCFLLYMNSLCVSAADDIPKGRLVLHKLSHQHNNTVEEKCRGGACL